MPAVKKVYRTIVVEEGIPIPYLTSRSTKWPFAHMEPGQSAHFENEDSGGRPYKAAMAVGLRRGWKFVARREGSGIRIWRVE